MLGIDVVLPILVLVLALIVGPLPLVIRGVIRRWLGPAFVQRWYRPVSVGVGLGMIGASALVAWFDPAQTFLLVLICLLVLLAVMDWQWRWLPIEWTLGVIALGVLQGISGGDIILTAQQIAVPSLTVLAIRQVLKAIFKRVALGLGDVWLIAGLGAFLPVTASFLLIGLAALSGLAELLFRRWRSADQQKTASVSYGTHLCVVFVIMLSFTQIN